MLVFAFSTKCHCKHTLFVEPEEVVWKTGSDNRARDIKLYGAVCPKCSRFNDVNSAELPDEVMKNAAKMEDK